MQLLLPDLRIADLVHLDVLDIRADGSYAINARFLSDAREAHLRDPAAFDRIFGDLILARALKLGYALFDVDELALAALEVAANDADA